MVTVVTRGAPRLSPTGVASSTTTVRSPSTTPFGVIGSGTVAMVWPAANVTVWFTGVKWVTDEAVPAVVVRTTTLWPAATDPVRVTVTIALPMLSLTLEAAAENCTVGPVSSSRIVTVATRAGPSTAPPPGLLSVRVKVSSPSRRASPRIATATSLFVSPARNVSRPERAV